MEKYLFNEEGTKAGYRGEFEGKDGFAKIAHLSVPVGLAMNSTNTCVGGKSTSPKKKYEDFDKSHTIFDKLFDNVSTIVTKAKKYTRKQRT